MINVHRPKHTHTHTQMKIKLMRSVDCINVNFLVVILYYRLSRYDFWGKLKEGYTGSLDYFLQLHINLQLSKNKKVNKKALGEIVRKWGFHTVSKYYFTEYLLT